MSKNVLIFSRGGVHFGAKSRGDGLALFLPSREQMRRFTDIGTINTRSVKERYGDIGQAPLWRQEGSTAIVYGLLPEALQERRSGLEIYLPEDFAPEGTSVFYFIFSNNLIIHGVRTINDDGQASWGTSKIDTKATGAKEALVESVSERIADGVRENICIAVHDKGLYEEISQAMEPFSQNVIHFSELSPSKDTAPLYVHRDHGLIYIILAMVSLMLFVGALFYAVSGWLSLGNLEDEIANLERQIQANKNDQRLGSVRNPNMILEFMSKPLKQRPSSVMHAAGEVATIFGDVQRVQMGTADVQTQLVKQVDDSGNIKWGQEKYLPVDVVVEGGEKYLLVDQERIARSALPDRPWIRYIERSGAGATGLNMNLEVGIKID